MPPVKLVFGPMLFGVFFNCILYGILVMQTFIYFQTYKMDATWIRWFMGYLLIMETINTGCHMATIYEPLILNYGTPHAVTFFPLLLAAAPVTTVLISTPVQMFTAWRITVISQGKIVGAAISLLALASLGGGIWTAIDVARFRRFARKPELHEPALVWLATSAVADVLLTTSLIWSLWRRKSGHSVTDMTVNRIIRLTVQTGTVTLLFAVADVVSFLVAPRTALNFAWDFCISKLYANALISTLNARSGWANLSGKNDDPDNVLFGKQTGPRTTKGETSISYYDTRQRSTTDVGPAPYPSNYELESATKIATADPRSELHINVTKHIAQDDSLAKHPYHLAH